MKASVLKPGLLVSLRTTIKGGVDYSRTDIEAEHETEDGASVARWETTRSIPDPAEFEAAIVVRGKARALVSSVCCSSAFGLLCPTAREEELQAAIAEAGKLIEEYHETARLTRVGVYVLVGRIAQDDAEAARAIGTEVRDLLEQMRSGIAAAQPDAIREAASKARALNGMLSADVAGKVSAAITEARKAAREITARVGKAGEAAADVVAEMSVRAIDAARFGVLDLDVPAADDEEEHAGPIGRAVDLAPVGEPGSLAASSMSLPFSLEV